MEAFIRAVCSHFHLRIFIKFPLIVVGRRSILFRNYVRFKMSKYGSVIFLIIHFRNCCFQADKAQPVAVPCRYRSNRLTILPCHMIIMYLHLSWIISYYKRINLEWWYLFYPAHPDLESVHEFCQDIDNKKIYFMDLKVNDKAWKIFIGSYVMMDRKKSPGHESELRVSLEFAWLLDGKM